MQQSSWRQAGEKFSERFHAEAGDQEARRQYAADGMQDFLGS